MYIDCRVLFAGGWAGAWLAATVWTLVVCLPAAAQVPATEALPPPAQAAAPRPIPVPPIDVLRREALRPLPQQLPDTQLRPGLLPPDPARQIFEQVATVPSARWRGAPWGPTTFFWQASELTHQPLYFEDVMLERHGQAHHWLLQPSMSATRFFVTLPLLPYKLHLEPPFQHISTLGHFRPGSDLPPLRQRLPRELGAGVFAAGVYTGLIFLVP